MRTTLALVLLVAMNGAREPSSFSSDKETTQIYAPRANHTPGSAVDSFGRDASYFKEHKNYVKGAVIYKF